MTQRSKFGHIESEMDFIVEKIWTPHFRYLNSTFSSGIATKLLLISLLYTFSV